MDTLFITNTFDRLNRLVAVTSSVPSVTSVVTHQHDPAGNVTNSELSLNNPLTINLATAYEFDAAERLTENFTTETQRFIYSYSPINGMVESVSNTVSGITCTYAHDIMDQVTNITYRTAGGSLIRSLDYAYNEVGMITNRTTEGGSQTAEISYVYDSLDRLVSESVITSTSSVPSVVKYQYDLAGNRLTKTVDGIGVSYTLGTGNRLASAGTVGVIDVEGASTEAIGTDDSWGELWVSNITAQTGWVPEIDGADFLIENLPVEPGTNLIVAAIRDQAGNMDYTTNTVVLSATNQAQTFAYNAAGCMTNLNGVSLEWDERYRLKKVDVIAPADSNLSSVVTYEYDVLGRRVSCSVGSQSQTNTTYFIYNGDQVAADLDGSGNLLRTYVWGTGIDNLLSFTDHTTSNTYCAVKDHQNSVIALIDENGSTVESYEYSAYGEITVLNSSGIEIHTSAVGNRYTFQGREIDWDTGLIYFRARWYDPDTGRWLSKDPIGITTVRAGTVSQDQESDPIRSVCDDRDWEHIFPKFRTAQQLWIPDAAMARMLDGLFPVISAYKQQPA